MKEPRAEGRYRQSDAVREILVWSQDRDLWQRDSLRQLMQGTPVEEIDLDRLEGLCMGEREDAVVLENPHLAVEVSGEQAVALSAVCQVTGVNALVPD